MQQFLPSRSLLGSPCGTVGRKSIARRSFLVRSALLAGGALWPRGGSPAPAPARERSGAPSVAAIVTEYRPWSHADVLCGRFIQGFCLDTSPHWTPVRVRAMYVDQ